MADVILQPGRDRSLRRRHPWVLSGAVARVEGEAAAGDAVRVVSAEGEVLGHGHWAPASRIRVRLLGFGKEDPGEGALEERIAAAAARRAADPLLAGTDAVRLVNSEGDGLPGLVADRFGPVVVAKLATAGMEARRQRVADALRRASGAPCGFERGDSFAARQEGIAARQGPLWGEPPEDPLWIHEGRLQEGRGPEGAADACLRRYRVDVAHGQKTGFYLDQRDSRDLVQTLARGRRVLDLFAYTGGFAVAAACGGAAAVTLVESSAEALALARENLAGSAPEVPVEAVHGDAFRFVRACESRRFDLLVVDPPPLAKRRADVPRAARAYKDVLLHALRCAAEGAYLLAFRCSHPVDAVLFRQIAFGASLDAGRPLQVLRQLGPPVDHPVALDHPEGDYLGGLLLRVA
jgi:23S rRNA (cytosine1962-C5)-methyltransferase